MNFRWRLLLRSFHLRHQRGDQKLPLSLSWLSKRADKTGVLLKTAAGLVKEVKAKAGAPVWRRDEQTGQFYALKLRTARAKAIALNPDDDAGPAGEGQRVDHFPVRAMKTP